MTNEDFPDTPTDPPAPPTIENVHWSDATHLLINATINGVPCFVPVDPSNKDYRNIQIWIAAGNVIGDPV